MYAQISEHDDDPINVTATFCEIFKWSASMQSENGVKSPMQIVFVQVILLSLFKSLFQLLLLPLGLRNFVPTMLGGIALGPSFLGQTETFKKNYLFSPKGVMALDIFEALGFTFHLFLLSMRLDCAIVRKCGRLAIIIGIASFVFPVVITTLIALLVRQIMELDQELHKSLPMMAAVLSTTSFHVILPLLADLKFLNSELGRLALSSSMISGMSSWAFVAICANVHEGSQIGSKEGLILTLVSKTILVLFILMVLRPIILWMRARNPDGKPLKESYIFAISLMVLVCSLFGEFTGQHFYFGPIVLGMATPETPPLGSTLMEKFDCFVEAVLMPCYIIDVGRRVNLYIVKIDNFAAVELLFFVSTLVKIASIVVPSIYYRLPLMDAFSLGLILSCKGLFDVQLFSRLDQAKLVTRESFTLLVISATMYSAIFTPLVRFIYDPSRRYIAYKGRTIQHTSQNSELRVLACIQQQDDVPSVISILELSNPTQVSPLGVYILNLKEAVEGALPLFIVHKLGKSPCNKAGKKMLYVLKAFHQFEQQNYGVVNVQCFTSVAPFATMHDDICSLALERTTSLVIIMFSHSDTASLRAMHKNVLEMASCSIGILYDRGGLRRCTMWWPSQLEVWMVFIGGPDDREALAFSARMASHPSVRLTVLRLIPANQSTSNSAETNRDMIMINDFRTGTMKNSNVKYVEEELVGGTETAQVLSGRCNEFDLILVGRRHDPKSSLLKGLSEWEEIEELGVLGDMLVSTKCKASVFILQQQAPVVEEMIESPRQFRDLQITSCNI